MKKFIPGTLLVAGLLTASGFVACHSFSTVRDPTVNGVGRVSIDSNRVSGLVYYLPKGRIRITGDFKSGSGDGGGAAAKPGVALHAQLAGAHAAEARFPVQGPVGPCLPSRPAAGPDHGPVA